MKGSSDPETWLQQYGDQLYRYALLRLRDPSAAEDAVQETLLAALEARARYAGQSSERTWLTGILKHKIMDHFRKQGRELAVEDAGAEMDAQAAYFDARGHWQVPIAPWDRPAAALEREEFQRVLADCIAALPGRLADLYILREVQGLPAEDLCRMLDISTTNNLWVMLSRIRMRLRRCLERNWFQTEPEGQNAKQNRGREADQRRGRGAERLENAAPDSPIERGGR